jgi:hypothetical protein
MVIMRLTIFDYSKSEYEPDTGLIESAGFDGTQSDVIKRMLSVLGLPKEDFDWMKKGCCRGFSEMWLVSHMITDLAKTKPKSSSPICDTKWFWNMMHKVMSPADSLDEKDISEIREFTEQVIFQQFFHKLIDIPRITTEVYTEIVDSKGELVPVYCNLSINGQLFEDDLIEFLERLDEGGFLKDQYMTLKFVYSFTDSHTIGILKKGDKWIFYDPNLKNGEMAYKDLRWIVGKIFAHYNKRSLAFFMTAYATRKIRIEGKRRGNLNSILRSFKNADPILENDMFFLPEHSIEEVHDKIFSDKERLKNYLLSFDGRGKGGFHRFISLYPELIPRLISEFSNPIDSVVLGELLAMENITTKCSGVQVLILKASKYLEPFLDAIEHIEHKHRLLGSAFLAVDKITKVAPLDLLFEKSFPEDLRNRFLEILCDGKCPHKDYVNSYIEIKKEYPRYKVSYH